MTFRRMDARKTSTLAALAGIAALLLVAAPASAAKIKYGISPQTTLTGSDYGLMNTLKTDLVRFGLSWPGVQQSPGNCSADGDACDWSFPDSQVGSAASNGIGSMLGIYGSAGFVNSDQAKPPVNAIDQWRSFIAAAVGRYGPGGAYWNGPYQAQFGAGAPVIPVRDWQIWNEPSSFQFFKPKPNVKKYAKILVPASDAIRGGDRKANVMLGGMFPDTGPKGIKIEKYLKALYKAKGVKAKTFDAVSIHPYAKDGKQLDDQISGARKVMNKSGGKKDDIWVTEVGYASAGPKSQPVVKKGEKGQAKAITEAYKTMHKKRNKYRLAGIVYFTWQDVNGGGVCKFCQRAGLLDTNGNQKKAFKAYKKAVK